MHACCADRIAARAVYGAAALPSYFGQETTPIGARVQRSGPDTDSIVVLLGGAAQGEDMMLIAARVTIMLTLRDAVLLAVDGRCAYRLLR